MEITSEWSHEDVQRFETNMRENCEELFGSISIISPPGFAVKVYKTTRYGVSDLLGRALVLLYVLRIKYCFYVVTCFNSTTVKTRTPKTRRSRSHVVLLLLNSSITKKASVCPYVL
jgi:hypothetical protein